MKLIAESQYEDQVVAGLTALLCDLGVSADGYTEDEAMAQTLISPDDVDLQASSIRMSREDQIALIRSIEDSIRTAMITAGYETIERAIQKADGGKAHISRRLGS